MFANSRPSASDFENVFSITRTLFSHSRSEQFWKQNIVFTSIFLLSYTCVFTRKFFLNISRFSMNFTMNDSWISCENSGVSMKKILHNYSFRKKFNQIWIYGWFTSLPLHQCICQENHRNFKFSRPRISINSIAVQVF